MITKHIVLASVLGAVIALGAFSASAAEVKGAVTAIDGGKFSIGDKTFSVSNSRTKVMVMGKEAKRDSIAVGMNCTAAVEGEEAKTVDCK